MNRAASATEAKAASRSSRRKRATEPDLPATAESRAEQSEAQRPAAIDQRRAAIEQAAYFRAEKRGFAPGHELDDWLAAEIELAGIQVEVPASGSRG